MADRVDITVLVDNYVDIFLPSRGVVSYPMPGGTSRLLGEQGLSLYIEVRNGRALRRILLDFGRSDKVLFHNAKILGIDVFAVDYLVLSHGHADHYGAFSKLVKRVSEKTKLVIHPAARGLTHFVRHKNGGFVGPWGIAEALLEKLDSRVTVREGRTHLGCGAYVSGSIRRRTPFERGLEGAFLMRDGKEVRDDIVDDQSLSIDVGAPGIVVITGCCHAGLVNTLIQAREAFPERPIYAAIGGFHLNGADERQMKATIDCLLELDVKYVAGLHCTGYFAQKRLMDALGQERWIPGAVGAHIGLPAGC